MMIFNNISEMGPFALLQEAAALFQSPLKAKENTAQIARLISDAASQILEEAEAYSLGGNLWRMSLALRLCGDENILGRAAELGDKPSDAITGIAIDELNVLCGAVVKIEQAVKSDRNLARLKALCDYTPSRRKLAALGDAEKTIVAELAEKIFTTATEPEVALAALVSFYRTYGSGIFALNRAFKWQALEREGAIGGRKGLVPISDLDSFSLDSLVGYEEQKTELLANTEQFLSGKTANNVLLFGDSGTGKSSSVRALLNEPGFARRGLRMIEVHKDQYHEIPEILNRVRSRNYRFVLFIDDLSFEEFEVEYKHLKAIIDGGLERKPDNVLIYATSNRRNLIREVWKDRKNASDDVHGWDTMQEKHSLADRFGVAIWYGSADKELYLEIVETMAREEGLTTPRDELERMALQWEVGRGGYTGRTARQFIQYARRAGLEADSR